MLSQITIFIFILLFGRACTISALAESGTVDAICDSALTSRREIWQISPTYDSNRSRKRNIKASGEENISMNEHVRDSWGGSMQDKRQAMASSGSCSFGRPACCPRCSAQAAVTSPVQAQPSTLSILVQSKAFPNTTALANGTIYDPLVSLPPLVVTPDRGPSPRPSNPGAAAMTAATWPVNAPLTAATLAISIVESVYPIPTDTGIFTVPLPVEVDYYATTFDPHRTITAAAVFTAGHYPVPASMTLICPSSTLVVPTTTVLVEILLPCFVKYPGQAIVGKNAKTAIVPVSFTVPSDILTSPRTSVLSTPWLVKGPPCWADDQGVHCEDTSTTLGRTGDVER